jgi:hypothetical protein
MMAHSSGEGPAVKRKDPKPPPAKTTSSEPPVKRRKRSLTSDTTAKPLVIDSDNTPVKSAEHAKAASIPVRGRNSRRKLAPSSVEHATTSVEHISVNDQNDNGVPSPIELEQSNLQHKEDVCERQKKKISKLEAELVRERAFTEQAQQRVKQDMMMDILREKEKLKKAEDSASLARRLYEKELAEHKVKLEKAAEKSLVERTQFLNAQRAIESYRMETEHVQHLNATLQSDLQELRAIEVEDKGARNDERRDLPPAYGNLNDEDRFPSYSKQADTGSIELASLKREIRHNFGRKVDDVLAKPGKASNTFCLLSAALNDASQSLRTVLDIAKDVPVSRAHAQGNTHITQQAQGAGPSEQPIATKGQLANVLTGAPIEPSDRQNERAAKDKRKRRRWNHAAANPELAIYRSANAAPYVADRIIKLLLDLLWRTVSACELRPSQESTSTMFDHTLPVMHTSVDETIVAALRIAFSKSHSLAAFQNYLMQIEILEKKFKIMGVNMSLGAHNSLTHFEFFSNTSLWLNDQVEKERELRANETVEKAVRLECVEDSDAVSSRWEGSDTASSDSEEDDE